MEKFANKSFEEIRNVTFAETSPDGKYVLYGVEGVCLENDKELGWLYLYDISRAESRQLTYSGNEPKAAWLNDHTIFFAGLRGESPKEPATIFYALDIFGGEARELFRVPVKTADARAIDDDRLVIYGIHDNSSSEDGSQDLWDVYDEYPYHADGRSYINKKRARIWLYSLKSGELTPLTDPLFQTCQNMNNRVMPILSDDKNRLYYWGKKVTNMTHPAGDAYVCDLETRESRLLFKNDRYMLENCIEHHGRAYFLGYVVGDDDLTCQDVISIGPGEEEYQIDLAPDDTLHQLSYDGKRILLTFAKNDRTEIYSWIPGNEPEFFFSPEYKVEGNFHFVNGAIYYPGRAQLDMRQLVELKDGRCRAVTNVGADFLKKYSFSACEPVQVKCPEGHSVYGWVIKPHGYTPGKKYPGLLIVHGGPQAAYINNLDFSMQRYAAEGYFVFYCNPRGSSNYGRAHMDLQGKFGSIDYDDIMAFTDEVLRQYSDLDGEQLGVTGGSYGGFMSNWIVGHTDRFKGAIARNSISNWVSMYGCTDISYFVSWGQCGTPWSNVESLWGHSPLKYADKCQTPLLLLQNERDYRCPVEQAEQMLTVLLERNIPARMVLFHNASHSKMSPQQRRRTDDEIIAWLDTYVKDCK